MQRLIHRREILSGEDFEVESFIKFYHERDFEKQCHAFFYFMKMSCFLKFYENVVSSPSLFAF